MLSASDAPASIDCYWIKPMPHVENTKVVWGEEEGKEKEKKGRNSGCKVWVQSLGGAKSTHSTASTKSPKRCMEEWVWILFINLSRLNTQFGQFGTGVLCGGIHELHFPVIVSHPHPWLASHLRSISKEGKGTLWVSVRRLLYYLVGTPYGSSIRHAHLILPLPNHENASSAKKDTMWDEMISLVPCCVDGFLLDLLWTYSGCPLDLYARNICTHIQV